eukprot:CAMPEP_0114148574 /NCGR_PEP_ID=MMETSP0043_2-20121206/21708_1 /TAXON_ID=464988 /ORGANISM="Hemiselmis andersenii, Strain CCMP644" /LENGTH=147 /DNA_ID=CAMNT_0001243179 /DNA_START=785 /DNA_END=1229 /DNA_ORIENTATION=-
MSREERVFADEVPTDTTGLFGVLSETPQGVALASQVPQLYAPVPARCDEMVVVCLTPAAAVRCILSVKAGHLPEALSRKREDRLPPVSYDAKVLCSRHCNLVLLKRTEAQRRGIQRECPPLHPNPCKASPPPLCNPLTLDLEASHGS